MTAARPDPNVQPSDIVFNCPHCGKSLAIDRHAAGLVVRCTDCGQLVGVPEPDRAPAEELDPAEDMAVRLADTEAVLERAKLIIRQYAQQIHELQARRTHLEDEHAEDLKRMDAVGERVRAIQGALEDIRRALDRRRTDGKAKTEIIPPVEAPDGKQEPGRAVGSGR